MKGGRLYILLLSAFLVIVFVSQLMAPHKFIWKPTYDKYDKEPFGSYVFDDVLSTSIDRYTIVNKTFYQLIQEDSISDGRVFLVTEANPAFTSVDIDNLYKIVHAGNQVMLCTDQFPDYLMDTLGFGVSKEGYSAFILKNVSNNKERVSIFMGADTLNPEHTYLVYSQILSLRINLEKAKRNNISSDNQDEEDTSDPDSSAAKTDHFYPAKCDSVEILVWDKANKPLAVRVFLGKGELFLVATPLMFTNFGMLDGANASYVFRLLSFMNGKPLTRIEAYGPHDEKPQTPLRYILSETPLRWATYTGLLLLLLFMVFTAKRRQRIIPVVKRPPNRSLGFMQLISNLYYQRHDNIEILKMKYMYFCADIKNHLGVELDEQVPKESDYERLFEKTGMEKDVINRLLQNIRIAIYRGKVIDVQLKQYIDGMNDLLRNIGFK